MNTILSDREYDAVYSNICDTQAQWVDEAARIAQDEVISRLCRREAFLDIGPGPGLLTRMIADKFSTTTIVEPNPAFRERNANSGFSVIPQSWQQAELSRRYDMIQCSYVLYHVPITEWGGFIDKMIDSLEPEGMALIVMGAPRGHHFSFRKTFNSDCVHSGFVIDYLKSRGSSFRVIEHTDHYTTETCEEMNRLCHFSIYESCFTQDEYDALSPDELSRIDAEILDFANEQKTPAGTYFWTYEADFIVVES